MAKSTHTHKGHCQACGRIQAVDNNTKAVAKHGYKVTWGFFSGTCPGSDKPALELQYTFTDSIVDRCEVAAVEARAKAADYASNRIDPKDCETEEYISTRYEGRKRVPGTGCYKRVPFEQGTLLQRTKARKAAVRVSEFDAECNEGHAKMLRELKGRVHGQQLQANKELNKPAPVQVEVGTSWVDADGITCTVTRTFSFGLSGRITRCRIAYTENGGQRSYVSSVHSVRKAVTEAQQRAQQVAA